MTDTNGTSLGSLFTRALSAIVFAFTIGAVIWLPVWLLYRPIVERESLPRYSHHGSFKFATLPADDTPLTEWFETQPVKDLRIERKDGSVKVNYWSSSRKGVEPPWERLGYLESRGSNTGSVGTSGRDLGVPFHLWVLVRCAGIGFLIVGLHRLTARLGPTGLGPVLWSRPARSATLGVVVGVLAMAVCWGYCLLPKLFGGSSLVVANQWAILLINPTWVSWAALVPVVVLLPVCEEVFYRGTIFGDFAHDGRVGLGAAVSALLFAVLQLNWVFVPVYFVLGLGLCFLYRRTGALLAPITAYAAFNCISIVLALAARTQLGDTMSTLLGR